MRSALAAGALALAACGSPRSPEAPETRASRVASPVLVERDGSVEMVDGCDEHGRPRDVSPRPAGDRVRIVRSCEGDLICQPGPRARLRDKLRCAGLVDEGAGKFVKTRPGPGPLHRRLDRGGAS